MSLVQFPWNKDIRCDDDIDERYERRQRFFVIVVMCFMGNLSSLLASALAMCLFRAAGRWGSCCCPGLSMTSAETRKQSGSALTPRGPASRALGSASRTRPRQALNRLSAGAWEQRQADKTAEREKERQESERHER